MLFEIHALTPADFDAWLAKAIAGTAGTPAPSGAPAPGDEPTPSGDAAAAAVHISAHDIAFEQTELTAPAGIPFKIDFDNEDGGVPHNVAIRKDSATGQEVFKGEIFDGPAKRIYEVPALAAGTYTYVCTVHPNMTGTLTVK
jgi:plastocyanin